MNTLEEEAPLLRFFSLNTTQLVAFFGFSCYLTWEFLGIFEMFPLLSAYFSFEDNLMLRAVMFLALFIGFMIASQLAHHRLWFSRPLLLAGSATSGATLLVSFVGSVAGWLPFWAGAIAWISFGLSLAFLMCLWAIHFETVGFSESPHVTIASYIIAFAVFFLLSLSKAPQETYLLIGFLLVDSTLVVCRFLDRSTPAEEDNAGKSLAKPSAAKAVHVGAYGIIYGFVLTFLLSFGELSALISCAGGLAGCLLAETMVRKNTLFTSIHLRRVAFAPVVVAVLFLPIGGIGTNLACIALIISIFICTAVASWSFMWHEPIEMRCDSIKHFIRIKAPSWFGFFIGTFAGGIVLSFAPGSFPIVVALLAALICISFSIFEMQVYGRKISGSDTACEPEYYATRFLKRRNSIIDGAGLSPREAEVFLLLAKGRNASHIAQALYIAKPTAKTHIQHIYQKLGVNSHQELIDVLDDEVTEQ